MADHAEIKIVDAGYILPGVAATYLFTAPGEGVIIETGTNSTVPRILGAIEEANKRPEEIEFIIITHLHLDHSGGVARLMERCKNATLLCHPRAVRHLIDPVRLVSGTQEVYGVERFQFLYGEIAPVDEGRIRAVEDQETIQVGNRTLRFFHTPGHARHHICIHDSLSNGMFTGDAFGIAYPPLQQNGLFIYPATTATDFDPILMRRTIERIVQSGCSTLYLTHYGAIHEVHEAAEMLFSFLDRAEAIIQLALERKIPKEELLPFCFEQWKKVIYGVMEERSIRLDREKQALLDIDLEINAGGIAYHIRHKSKTANGPG